MYNFLYILSIGSMLVNLSISYDWFAEDQDAGLKERIVIQNVIDIDNLCSDEWPRLRESSYGDKIRQACADHFAGLMLIAKEIKIEKSWAAI